MKRIILFLIILQTLINFSVAQPYKLEYSFWPHRVSGCKVTAIYGENTQSDAAVMHDGLDIFCAVGTYVVAARSGVKRIEISKPVKSLPDICCKT